MPAGPESGSGGEPRPTVGEGVASSCCILATKEPNRRLAVMNLAIRGIDADFGPENADTLKNDLHKDLKADFVIANPPAVSRCGSVFGSLQISHQPKPIVPTGSNCQGPRDGDGLCKTQHNVHRGQALEVFGASVARMPLVVTVLMCRK